MVRSARLAELEQEPCRSGTSRAATHEQMQTSQEELRSANEELQSTNEELQSTNEELTTSKEEMQSLNEELQTVNAELQAKVDEFTRTSNDMKNLLNSTDIATLFLDKDLNVRRFTPQATKIIKLIPADAGRPITDLASDLRYPELAADARGVLQKLASVEKPIGARDGRWFSVRIMPYRTMDERIDGVVITFADITVAKKLEAKLRGQHASLEKHVAQQSGKPVPTGKRAKPMSIAAKHEKNRQRRLALTRWPELRRRAEAEACASGREKAAVRGHWIQSRTADTQRLFHELQVHQVELEMQNAELRQARDELEVALENYTDLYDFAPVGYFTLAADGTIQQGPISPGRNLGRDRAVQAGGAILQPVVRRAVASRSQCLSQTDLREPDQTVR